MAIYEFQGENRFLSSMWPLDNGIVTAEGREVSCVEIAYLPERFLRPEDRERVYSAKNGYDAKRITNRLVRAGAPIDPDWQQNKLGKLTVMRSYVAQKFERNPELAERLVATGDQELIEGNSWDDTFWGVYPVGSNNGENHLGRILMEERRILREQMQPQEGLTP